MGPSLPGLPSLGLLSNRSITFQPAATVCLGKVALWARRQEGPGQHPRQTSFHHRSQSWLGLSWCQHEIGRTLPHPPEGRLRLWVSRGNVGGRGARIPGRQNPKRGSRGRDPDRRAFLLTLHAEAGHQELDSWDGSLALEWPLATAPDRHYFITLPG